MPQLTAIVNAVAFSMASDPIFCGDGTKPSNGEFVWFSRKLCLASCWGLLRMNLTGVVVDSRCLLTKSNVKFCFLKSTKIESLWFNLFYRWCYLKLLPRPRVKSSCLRAIITTVLAYSTLINRKTTKDSFVYKMFASFFDKWREKVENPRTKNFHKTFFLTI